MTLHNLIILLEEKNVYIDDYDVIIRPNCNLDGCDLEIDNIDTNHNDKLIIINTKCRE